MPTDIQVDEELVAILLRDVEVGIRRASKAAHAPPLSPLDANAREVMRQVLEASVTEHRLVRLPEEPERWEVETVDLYNGGGIRWVGTSREAEAREWATMPDSRRERSTGRIVAIRFHRSPPETVTSEEARDGR